MVLNFIKNTVLIFVLASSSCGSDMQSTNESTLIPHEVSIIIGANQTERYLPLLNGKKIGIVANQTSVIFNNDNYVHLVDSLKSSGVNIIKVFAPEHGFRGKADAGEQVIDGVDMKTGLPILSLYGKNKKPSIEQLKGIEMMIFDIQDVGARFYTYISSLHYVMEACADNNIPVLILDRPNPNGHYVDGPILEMEHESFVGMHPVPVVHGMTIGEYAKMINGEGWLENGIKCDIIVIPVKNYTHTTAYSLPIKPSPNLPNDKSINLYPSLCFFEGTNVSVGRGTDMQFQVIGSPLLSYYSFAFTPQPNEGAKYPKHQGKTCSGKNLQNTEHLNELNLDWLIEFYSSHEQLAPSEPFFNDFFTKLAGTKNLQEQIENGLAEAEIKASWQEGLNAFKELRKKYLIYD
ncbi:MAG: DUF1343 domain-containing protein [Flavobacteriaceae bacterium]|nr:DUF1343 domain-containing protein [Bacteroidia bacterium]NNL61090.1 DUF1343 domain-containing protein [Flavobacteriaceae bacterium]